MANAELYQGQDRGFVEKSAWYLTGVGLATLAVGLIGGIDNLVALGLVMTVGGLIMDSSSSRSK